MVLKEEKRDLFGVDDTYALAHCIALDCAMGAGIATQFVKRYPKMRGELKNAISKHSLTYPTVISYCGDDSRVVFNMITKEKSYGKPTYDSFNSALFELVHYCKTMGITKLAIPKIGCGLDRLDWSRVKVLIEEAFKDLAIEIVVCYID